MKKFILIAAAILGLALSAQAQVRGIGYAELFGVTKEITLRLGLGQNALDIGVGLNFDNSKDSSDEKLGFDFSGTFLGHLHEWGPVDTYFAAGALFQKFPRAKDNIAINLFAGFQPEVTLMDHIALSTRLGLNIPIQPDVSIQTFGAQISVVSGLNFTVLF